MKVRLMKSVDFDCEVEVDQDDILSEFYQRLEEATPDHWRRLLRAIDMMTAILAHIPDEVIAALPDNACQEIVRRLTAQATRYDRTKPLSPSPTTLRAELGRLLDRLEKLRTLKFGWDSYSAKPIAPESIEHAKALLQELCDLTPDLESPQIIPTSFGTISLEWHIHGVDVEVVVLPNGECVLQMDSECLGSVLDLPVPVGIEQINVVQAGIRSVLAFCRRRRLTK